MKAKFILLLLLASNIIWHSSHCAILDEIEPIEIIRENKDTDLFLSSKPSEVNEGLEHYTHTNDLNKYLLISSSLSVFITVLFSTFSIIPKPWIDVQKNPQPQASITSCVSENCVLEKILDLNQTTPKLASLVIENFFATQSILCSISVYFPSLQSLRIFVNDTNILTNGTFDTFRQNMMSLKTVLTLQVHSKNIDVKNKTLGQL